VGEEAGHGDRGGQLELGLWKGTETLGNRKPCQGQRIYDSRKKQPWCKANAALKLEKGVFLRSVSTNVPDCTVSQSGSPQ
jgi:hypothetical protein